MLVFAVALVAAVRCAAAPRSDALAYEADGVAVWRGVVAADEVAALRGAYDAWAANASFDGAVTVNFCSPWPTLWPGAPACDSGVAPIVEDLLRAAAAAAARTIAGDGGARARLPAHARGRERRDEPAVVAGGGAGARLRAGARGGVRPDPAGAPRRWTAGAWEVWPGSHRTAAVAGDGVVVATAPGDVIGLRPAVFHRRTANSFARAPAPVPPSRVRARGPRLRLLRRPAALRRARRRAGPAARRPRLRAAAPVRALRRRRLEIAGALLGDLRAAAGDPLAAFRRSPAYEALGRGVNGACALAAALAAARGDAPADLGVGGARRCPGLATTAEALVAAAHVAQFRAASPVAPARVFELAPSSPQLAFEIARPRPSSRTRPADLPLLSALQCAALAASGLRPFPFACLDVHGFAGETAALWPPGRGARLRSPR
ncbi:hypothetical protein SO694_00018413 [Aureococcus anophagefferens]|uniref:Uncharacterized protein n=1 Tax=Aureococcus anophagefferens TaxID=44056 RepID=A0ABR1G1J9_AURAN